MIRPSIVRFKESKTLCRPVGAVQVDEAADTQMRSQESTPPDTARQHQFKRRTG